MLTDLQKSRIRYHLDITYRSAYEEIQANFKLMLDNIDPNRELAIVGNQSQLDYSFLGEPLCQTGSILHKVELAYERLSPTTIDTSTFVKNTEEVTLNPNELRLRKRLYDAMVDQLRNCFDLPKETISHF